MEQQLAKQKIKEFKRTRNLNMVKYTGLVYGILLFISGASKGSREEDPIDFKKMFIGLFIISLSASIISDDKDRYDKETIGLIFATLILIALLFVQLNLKDNDGNILTQNIIKIVFILIIVSLMLSFNYVDSNAQKKLIQTIPSIAIIIVVINTFTSFGVPNLPNGRRPKLSNWVPKGTISMLKKRKAEQKIRNGRRPKLSNWVPKGTISMLKKRKAEQKIRNKEIKGIKEIKNNVQREKFLNFLLGLNEICIKEPPKSKSSFGTKFNEKTKYFIDLLTDTVMPILYFVSIIVLYAD